jgi:hypothetical protein
MGLKFLCKVLLTQSQLNVVYWEILFNRFGFNFLTNVYEFESMLHINQNPLYASSIVKEKLMDLQSPFSLNNKFTITTPDHIAFRGNLLFA